MYLRDVGVDKAQQVNEIGCRPENRPTMLAPAVILVSKELCIAIELPQSVNEWQHCIPLKTEAYRGNRSMEDCHLLKRPDNVVSPYHRFDGTGAYPLNRGNGQVEEAR